MYREVFSLAERMLRRRVFAGPSTAPELSSLRPGDVAYVFYSGGAAAVRRGVVVVAPTELDARLVGADAVVPPPTLPCKSSERDYPTGIYFVGPPYWAKAEVSNSDAYPVVARRVDLLVALSRRVLADKRDRLLISQAQAERCGKVAERPVPWVDVSEFAREVAKYV
ncbi:MAG: hypothetical protein ACPL3C_11785 [Pyrobaculum sp.]|uniref:hypothetical protein n=1 Tax=Pyrobaculum sp. TaxID=2004705 RepID=UPI003C8D31C4